MNHDGNPIARRLRHPIDQVSRVNDFVPRIRLRHCQCNNHPTPHMSPQNGSVFPVLKLVIFPLFSAVRAAMTFTSFATSLSSGAGLGSPTRSALLATKTGC